MSSFSRVMPAGRRARAGSAGGEARPSPLRLRMPWASPRVPLRMDCISRKSMISEIRDGAPFPLTEGAQACQPKLYDDAYGGEKHFWRTVMPGKDVLEGPADAQRGELVRGNRVFFVLKMMLPLRFL